MCYMLFSTNFQSYWVIRYRRYFCLFLHYATMVVLGVAHNILTYRNNPSYTSMGILIFLSVSLNTDQIRMKLRLFQAHLMCSRN